MPHCKPIPCNENRISLCPHSHKENLVFIAGHSVVNKYTGILFSLHGFLCMPPDLVWDYSAVKIFSVNRKSYEQRGVVWLHEPLTLDVIGLVRNVLAVTHSNLNFMVWMRIYWNISLTQTSILWYGWGSTEIFQLSWVHTEFLSENTERFQRSNDHVIVNVSIVYQNL